MEGIPEEYDAIAWKQSYLVFFFRLHEAERALRVSNASLGDSETFPKRPFREKVFLSHTLNKHLKN